MSNSHHVLNKYIKFLLLFLVITFLVTLSFIHLAVADGPTECDENASPSKTDTNSCVYKNYGAWLQQTGQQNNSTTRDKYFDIVSGCMDYSGVGTGLGGKGDGGDCNNAMFSCYRITTDKSKCEDGNYIGSLTAECGSNGVIHEGDNCDPSADANFKTIKGLQDANNKAIEEACPADSGTSDANRTGCINTYKAASKACADKYGLDSQEDGVHTPDDDTWTNSGNNGQFNRSINVDEYKKCLKTETRERITNPDLCDQYGGIYMDKDYNDANGYAKNNVKKGCREKYSDLTTPEACAAAGAKNRNTGVWAQEPGKTGNVGWGCHDPSKVCKKDSGYTINDRAPCKEAPKTPADPDDTTPNRTVNFHAKEDFETCGTASVNLLSCSDAADGACPGSGRGQPFEGVQVLGCVLKIGLQALTVLVGIGAVGGIAYSSFRYASASDNAGAVTEAKGRIRDIVIGLIVYVFLLAVVQWLVPGLVMDTGISSSGTPAAQASP